jgi:hypothetical protein
MLKDQVRNFDDGITKPFITSLYYWNMEFSDKEHIKGDMQIDAKGSASLIAKEVHTERLTQLMAATGNPMDAPMFRRDEMWRDVFKYYDMKTTYVKTPEEIQAQQQQDVMAQEQARVMTVIQDAVENGVPIDRIYMQLLEGADPRMVSEYTSRAIEQAAS